MILLNYYGNIINKTKAIYNRVPITKFPIHLDIGCGKKTRDGYKGLDIIDFSQEFVWDIEKGLPLPDKSVSDIYSSHTFEHLHNLIFIMNECWRVLVKNGILYIIVQHMKREEAFDPTHKRFFNEQTWRAFEKEFISCEVRPWEILDYVENERLDIHVKLTK